MRSLGGVHNSIECRIPIHEPVMSCAPRDLCVPHLTWFWVPYGRAAGIVPSYILVDVLLVPGACQVIALDLVDNPFNHPAVLRYG